MNDEMDRLLRKGNYGMPQKIRENHLDEFLN
jgi:hypothetical protein